MDFIRQMRDKWVIITIVASLVMAGGFGYIAWRNASREAAEWTSADGEMRQLLQEQSSGAPTRNPDYDAKTTTKQEKQSAKPPALTNSSEKEAARSAVSAASSDKELPDEAIPQHPADKQSDPSGAPTGPGGQGPDGTAAPKTNVDPATDQPATSVGFVEKPSVPAPAPKEKQGNGKQIRLNQANIDQLMELPGIGEAKAKAIIAYREQIGGRFQSANQLLEVKGIGEKVLAKLKPFLADEW